MYCTPQVLLVRYWNWLHLTWCDAHSVWLDWTRVRNCQCVSIEWKRRCIYVWNFNRRVETDKKKFMIKSQRFAHHCNRNKWMKWAPPIPFPQKMCWIDSRARCRSVESVKLVRFITIGSTAIFLSEIALSHHFFSSSAVKRPFVSIALKSL